MNRLHPGLVSSFAVAALIEFGTPLVLAVFLSRRFGARWRFWFLGVLVFLLFQGLTRVPIMIWVQTRPAFAEAMKNTAFAWLFLGIAALTAGLFEEGGRWLAYRYAIRPADRTWTTATMMGAGHGGLESMLIGVITAVTLAVYTAIYVVPPESLGELANHVESLRETFAQTPASAPLLGAWERVAAIALHVALSVMVLLSFVRGFRWWWYALAAHALVDFAAVGTARVAGQAWGQSGGAIAVEVAMIPVAVASVWFIVRMQRTWDVAVAPTGEETLGIHLSEEANDGPSPDG